MTSVVVLALVLHEGGWDELLMVGVGLVVAYAIIMLTGRKGDGAEDAADEEAVEADEPSDRRS